MIYEPVLTPAAAAGRQTVRHAEGESLPQSSARRDPIAIRGVPMPRIDAGADAAQRYRARALC
jgi:hypothetical protein